jgi:hypothetical protein
LAAFDVQKNLKSQLADLYASGFSIRMDSVSMGD